jgi:sugar lactone lactonase YvrE
MLAFDLRTGKLVRRVMLPDDGHRHFLNALVIDRDGNVYITDSGGSGIYRLRSGSDRLEVFVSPTVFDAAQGLAFSADQRTLYIADWSDGVWSLDLRTKARQKLRGPSGVWLGGLDGLTRDGDALISVQIGVQPNRVLRLRLDPAGTRIAAVYVLEMSHPDYEGPIQGALGPDSSFLYVANSQLDLGNGTTGAFAADKARPTVVLRLPLR